MKRSVKTCAILTINDDGNYGNRLQNYALSQILSSVADVSTIRMFLRTESKIKFVLLVMSLPILIIRAILTDRRVRSAKAKWGRARNFLSFSRRIPTGKFRLSTAAGFENKTSGPGPDRIIIGSDQVWNYNWISSDELKLRLGMFAPSEQLICYAASIGLDDIDEKWRPLFREGWSRIPHISVREDRAAELVKEIAGLDAAVVLDPTLLLSRNEWAELCTGFVPNDDRYVLAYFLGRPSDRQEMTISTAAKKLKARIRRVNDASDSETYSAGPAEFVELISKACYIFTDSYHACCFSILFNRPFKAFRRIGTGVGMSMNSRMRTLFRLFQIDDYMDDDEKLPTFDWQAINRLRHDYRRESIAWLEATVCRDVESESR